MRLILHVGMGKTGTSTLQKVCAGFHSQLADAGTLYPIAHQFPMRRHQALASLSCVDGSCLSREFGQLTTISPGDLAALSAAFWDEIVDDVTNHRPDTVVLLYEGLFPMQEDCLHRLRSHLERITTDIDVVSYVRHPASYWLSLSQQRVKASHIVPAPWKYRNHLAEHVSRFQRVFDGRVNVRAYDRAELVNGDIVADFFHHYLPEHQELVDQFDGEPANVSVSAEAMCIMQEFRAEHFADRPNQFAQASNDLFEALRAVAPVTPQHAPKLQPGLQSRLTQTHAGDLTLLHDMFSVSFSSIVPEPDGALDAVSADLRTSRQLRDVLIVDPADIDATRRAAFDEIKRRGLTPSR